MTHSAASVEGSSRDSQALAIDEGTWYMSPIVMNSPTRRRIRRAVYGDEFPEDADPSSYITVTELRRFARDLRVGPGDAFVDLGCGRGGPGLWVARETGADVVGIDVAPMAVEYSTQTAAEFGLSARASYQVGDFCSTRMPPGSLDGAMSVDVLWAVPDKVAALREVARILRPSGRFLFTSWDYATPLEGDTQVSDHRPLGAGHDLPVRRAPVRSRGGRCRGAFRSQTRSIARHRGGGRQVPRSRRHQRSARTDRLRLWSRMRPAPKSGGLASTAVCEVAARGARQGRQRLHIRSSKRQNRLACRMRPSMRSTRS